MPQAIHISPIDNVVVALHPIAKGTLVEVDGLSVTALEDMHRRGVPIALITDKGLSPVHPFADIVFHCATDSSAFLPCYTGCLALIDVICQAVCMEHRSEITEYVRDLEKRLLAQGVWM
mgnify:CR=1 FL=1